MPTHEIPGDRFDALAASRADADAVETLRRAVLSRRLLLLRTVLERVSAVLGATGPTRDAEQAFDLLARTQATAPDVVAQTLLHPQVGGWAARAIRAFGEPEVDPAVLGGLVRHLGAIAASAAIRAGDAAAGAGRAADDFEVPVPVDQGRVRLPMLGCLRLDEPRAAGRAEALVRRTGGAVEVVFGEVGVALPADPSRDAGPWRALRRLNAEADGRRLTVALDDADPYRLYHGLTPAADLDDGDVQRWQRLFTDAWRILVSDHASFAEAIGRGLTSIVPLPPSLQAGVSATSADAFGAAAISLPEGAVELAVALVHEYQHSKLSALLDLVPLYQDDGRLYYAPWRRDPRPVGGLLQGCYAHAGIAAFWRVRRGVATAAEAPAAAFEYERWRDAVRATADLLLRSGALTAAGTRFVEGLRGEVAGWGGEAEARASRAARLADLDHRTTWRLRNARPDRDAVERLAAAWNAGRPVPEPASTPAGATAPAVPTAIGPGDFSPLDDARTRLLRRGFRDSHTERTPVGSGPEGADALLARGEDAAAARMYRRQLLADPSDVVTWAGFVAAQALPALVARSTPAVPPSLELLISRPELVFAVHRAVVSSGAEAPDPEVLAEWLSRSNGQSAEKSA